MAGAGPTFRDMLNRRAILPFAHRGAGLLAPENTRAAFAQAVALGYPVIETDIQASADGSLYVFHDRSLQRLTGEDRTIDSLSDRDIRALRVNGDHAIPKLADMLEEFPETCFNLDAKTWPCVAPMAELIRRTGSRDRLCIGSFSEARIKAVLAELGGDICHSLGTAAAVRFYFGSLARIPLRFTADCLQFPVVYKGVTLVNRRTVDYAHRLGLKLHVWTVNDSREMHRLIDLGVDGLMTDDCHLMKGVLSDRGLWPAD